ncbi:group I intron-associated PD-(D/E)XK endonuclease [Halobaculum magnesiiphilum]|uniref:group I intron-associated PD-(D/E)XK endonuclease n=1 Tax=Halobaculum magnesiiphilum TaxID=1017351 RepID=UPI001CEC4819|nr:group I intron-associated PD-(D/E)XK endonuclease [Halobaculum magnesiiphilum]
MSHGAVNTKQVGDETEADALRTLISNGYNVSIPFGDNDAYDLVVDNGDRLFRVQCKTAWQNKAETIRFNTHSQTTRDGEYHETTYGGSVDAFLVRYPETGTFYWIRVDDATSQKMELRFSADIDHPAINWAEEYEFDGAIPCE